MRTAFLVALLIPWAAAAQVRPITVALASEPIEGCELDGLAADVERRLGRDVFGPEREAEFVVRVDGSTTEEGLGLRVVVEQLGRNMGERHVEVSSCEEMRDRAALIVALVVDTQLPRLPPVPSLTAAAGLDDGSGTPAADSPAGDTNDTNGTAEGASAEDGGASTEASEPAASDAEVDEGIEESASGADLVGEPIEVQLSLVGAAHVGWFPSIAGGGGLGVAVRGHRWTLRADAFGWLPDDSLVQEPVSIRIFGAALRLGGCVGGDLRALHLAGCAVVETGALRVEGRGLDDPDARWRFSLRGGLEARATLSVRAVRIGLAIGLDAPIVRDRFVFAEADASTQVAHEPGPVGGIALLSVGFAIP